MVGVEKTALVFAACTLHIAQLPIQAGAYPIGLIFIINVHDVLLAQAVFYHIRGELSTLTRALSAAHPELSPGH